MSDKHTLRQIQRFWANVERLGPDECWPWLGACHPYGAIRWTGGRQQAHRVAFALTYGEPTGTLHHTCENKKCCNPAHLIECASNGDHHKTYHAEKSREHMRRIGEAGKGVPKSPEHRAKIGAANKGKPKSPEHRAKIAAALTGRKRPDISERLRGVPVSEARRQQIIEMSKDMARDPVTGRWLPRDE